MLEGVQIERPAGDPGDVADADGDPQQLLDEQTRAAFTALARRGIDDGVLRPDLGVDTLYELIIGTAFYAIQVQHRTDTADLIDQLHALALQGAMRRDTT